MAKTIVVKARMYVEVAIQRWNFFSVTLEGSVDVKPVKTTTYTLTATGADGKTVTQTVSVEVR